MNYIISLLITAAAVQATVITDQFLERVAHVESGHRADAVGDSGKAVGAFQFWAIGWEHASQLRKASGQPVWPYYAARDYAKSKEYARTYLTYIERSLAKALGRQPTVGEIYAAWNCGLGRFRQLGYDLNRVPATTKRAIAKL
jgi:hypothetical protein